MDGLEGSASAVRSGFDFTRHMRGVCADMVGRLPELSHIDLTRVAISFAQARKGGARGLYASLTPMRFAGGSPVVRRRGVYFGTQTLRDETGREMLYLLSFCLPRFLNLEFREKLATIVHELWHIGPRFDGDIRRHAGRCHVHSGSQQRYDAAMMRLAEKWLALGPPEVVYRFLRFRFAELQQRCGPVYGLRVTRPKLIPLSADQAQRLLGGGGE